LKINTPKKKVSVTPVKKSRIQLIEIEDPAFLEKYTAYVTQKNVSLVWLDT
jgi:hypothetical protein